MKLQFEIKEKRFVKQQLEELAVDAGTNGDRGLSKTLVTIANHFSDNNHKTIINGHEAVFIVDMLERTNKTLTAILEKIKNSDKTEEEKTEANKKTDDLIAINNSAIQRMKDKMNVGL